MRTIQLRLSDEHLAMLDALVFEHRGFVPAELPTHRVLQAIVIGNAIQVAYDVLVGRTPTLVDNEVPTEVTATTAELRCACGFPLLAPDGPCPRCAPYAYSRAATERISFLEKKLGQLTDAAACLVRRGG